MREARSSVRRPPEARTICSTTGFTPPPPAAAPAPSMLGRADDAPAAAVPSDDARRRDLSAAASAAAAAAGAASFGALERLAMPMPCSDSAASVDPSDVSAPVESFPIPPPRPPSPTPPWPFPTAVMCASTAPSTACRIASSSSLDSGAPSGPVGGCAAARPRPDGGPCPVAQMKVSMSVNVFEKRSASCASMSVRIGGSASMKSCQRGGEPRQAACQEGGKSGERKISCRRNGDKSELEGAACVLESEKRRKHGAPAAWGCLLLRR